MIQRYGIAITLTFVLAAGFTHQVWTAPAQTARPSTTPEATGGSATQLPDGRWLVLGGDERAGASTRAAIVDPATGVATPLSGRLNQARAGHTATLLPDGSVLVTGGRNGSAYVELAEIFDPATGFSTSLAMNGSVARELHTATLLTDGRVLVAGGANGAASGAPAEIWDLQTQTVTPLSIGVDRVEHTATLQDDGRVLLAGGRDQSGRRVRSTIVDPVTMSAIDAEEMFRAETGRPVVAASSPAPDAIDVPLSTRIVVRFSEAVRLDMLNGETVTLNGPQGTVATRVVGAERGHLLFVWPLDPLVEGATYELTIAGPATTRGVLVAPASIRFTTVQPRRPSDAIDNEEWRPTEESTRNGWRTNRPPSPWESFPPLVAPPGVTAISGRVLTLDGRPLAGVTLEVEGMRTESDRTGRFLLVTPSMTGGRHVLDIEGETASRPGRNYGFFEYGTTVVRGQTTILPFTIWMPKLDLRHTVRIPSPTTREVVITTPSIPGLELHIPPNTIIRGEDGQPITELGITAIPVDRPPFPLASNVIVPVYFTIQPGGGYINTLGSGSKGAWLVYPNYRHGYPGQRVQFFHYDPPVKGWYVYGPGTVTANGVQVVPDPKTRLYAFTGAMINFGNSPPAKGPRPDPDSDGDPVDPSTGVFVMSKTDLYLPDVIPIGLTRTYNSGDALAVRPFGRGMTHPYAMFLWSASQYQEADLVLPDGAMIHYTRTTPGNDVPDALFEHTTTPTKFYKSTIVWNGNGWDLKLTDGTVYVFGENAPLKAIRDRYGNTVTITLDGLNRVTHVTSPNYKWLAFTYDGSQRISQVTDNLSRKVTYTYDSDGNLSTATDADNKVTTYTYGSGLRMETIRDGRNIVYLTNEYFDGRVTRQTLADPSAAYQFSYTVDGAGNVTRTDVTDPRGNVRRLTYSTTHYVTTYTEAFGTALERSTTLERQVGTNFVTAVTDGLSRRTAYTYDGYGHILTATQLAGTPSAVTTTFTYEPKFFQLASVTDPLNHTWMTSYDTIGRVTGSVDPLDHHSTLVMDAAGQVTTIADALNHAWHIGYADGYATSVADPSNATHSSLFDGGGRLTALKDPLNRVTRLTSDKMSRTTSVTDPVGGQTLFTYDANGNLLAMTDALTHVTSYTYDSSDRVATMTDPLSRVESFDYDLNGNLIRKTDREGQLTNYQYDALDRLALVVFDNSATIAYTYDAGDRVTGSVDSVNGTISRQYDLLDRLTQETTPQGTVEYTYSSDDLRSTMTVAGQPVVTYDYDDAHRLTSITQGSAVVTFTYDDAGRRSTLTYPNGIVATYGHDSSDRLTNLTYAIGTTTLGEVSYTHDANGNRATVSGSWARTALPPAMGTATYDAANHLTTWDSTTLDYDLNGSLASDGLTSYAWNVRNQLMGLSGATSAGFTYDADGRRRGKAINGATMTFLYDGWNVVQEGSGGGPLTNLLTGQAIDETFTRDDGSSTRALLVDGLGSTLELADAWGVPQTHYTFEPFGAAVVSGTASTNATQFTGREDDGTGLNAYRARFYSSRLQRFVSEDPIHFAGGDLNLYAYVGNNPTNRIDPLGLDWLNNVVNYSAGFGDALLLNTPVYVRDKLGWQGVVNRCSTSYSLGGWTTAAISAARLGYAAAAKAGSVLATTGEAASAFRNTIKNAARLNFGKGFRPPNLAKYPTDAALRAAAGRTNPVVNAWGAGSAVAGAMNGRGCGCD